MAARVDPELWTIVVPAAGRGSRLDYHLPKILYPVAGRLALDWLLDVTSPLGVRLLFVVSPTGKAPIVSSLAARIRGHFEVVVQESPTGMADAVALALPGVSTRHVAVLWGDQIALRSTSVEACLRLHQGVEPDATCPTVLRHKPYIHFVRDGDGHIASVLQAREGDVMPEMGESDAGFFCFRTDSLRSIVDGGRRTGVSTGCRTGESNLLPLIPLLACNGVVLTPLIADVDETIGINDAQDVAAVAEVLERRRGARA